MVKENKVLIEKFKGFEIYYDKSEEVFVADKDKLDIHFEGRSLWDIKGRIKQSKTEEINEDFYIKSGYFDSEVSKIKVLTINKETKRCRYKILEDTKDGYDVGSIKEDYDIPETYPIDKKNTNIYNLVKKLEQKKEKLKQEQKDFVIGLQSNGVKEGNSAVGGKE